MLFASTFRVLCAVLCAMPYVAATTPTKDVFAHFIVGNAYGYTTEQWIDDISKAKDAHIDGFALNIAPQDSYTATALQNAYSAATQVGGFKLFLSFDYLSGGPWPLAQVVSTINSVKSQPSQYLVDGKVFVSTFEGVNNAADWVSIKAQVPIYFVPSWTSMGPGPCAANPSVDGALAWAAWPQGANDMDTKEDEAWMTALGSKAYMMAVSPWFYTNLPQWNKNWLWRGDDLWYDRWQQVLELQPAMVEILTWNDFGESHHIGPVRPGGVPSGAQRYVDPTPHDHWRDVLPVYIDAYKSGNTTAPNVTKDKVSFWYRPTPAAVGSNDGTTANNPDMGQPPLNPESVVQDKIFVDAILKGPATVTVQVGSSPPTTLRGSHAGVNHFAVPFAGRTGKVTVSVVRNGKRITSGSGIPITNSCPEGKTNYNAFVGGSN